MKAFTLLCVATLLGGASQQKYGASAQATKPTATKPAVAKPVPPANTTRLAYDWKIGETYRYKVNGVFNGHIPPFARPESPPIHIRVDLQYTAQPKKKTDKGVEVVFTVETADLTLLSQAPNAKGELPPDAEEVPFPLPLQQVQDALNVTAVVAPSGEVMGVGGGDANSVRVNFGFELRKIFLLMLPVAFSEKPIAPNTAWAFQDGLLGKKAGKTFYSAQWNSSPPQGASRPFTVSIKAKSEVEERTDKENKPTEKPEETVITTTGKASLTTTAQFVATQSPDGRRAGRVQQAKLALNIDVLSKRSKPNPDNPEEPLETRIDVQAMLTVRAVPPPKKTK